MLLLVLCAPASTICPVVLQHVGQSLRLTTLGTTRACILTSLHPCPFPVRARVCGGTQVNLSCKEACAALQQDSVACKEMVGGLLGQAGESLGGLRKKYGLKG